MQSNIYEFYKNNKKDKVWWVTHYIMLDKEKGIADVALGELLISFDKKKIYSLWSDYPKKFTKEQKELFDKENPYWKEFFKHRQ